jgi:hypothetical protein
VGLALTGFCRSIFFWNPSAENKFPFGSKGVKAGQRDAKGFGQIYSIFRIKLNGALAECQSRGSRMRLFAALCGPFAVLCRSLPLFCGLLNSQRKIE